MTLEIDSAVQSASDYIKEPDEDYLADVIGEDEDEHILGSAVDVEDEENDILNENEWLPHINRHWLGIALFILWV